MLCDHLGVSKSTQATRFMRNIFPAEWVIQCALETGASLLWLTTGQGAIFVNFNSDIVECENLVKGKLFAASHLLFDNVLFEEEVISPTVVIHNGGKFLCDYGDRDIRDGKWLMDLDGKSNFRDVIRMPVDKVRILNENKYFDCEINDVVFQGKVIYKFLQGGINERSTHTARYDNYGTAKSALLYRDILFNVC